MRNARTRNLFRTLLSLALLLPMTGCVLEAEEDLGDVETLQELVLDDGTLVEVSPAAGCTVSAATPFRGTRVKDNVSYDAVIGSARVNCSSRTNIYVRATLRNESTGRNGFWGESCNNSTSCGTEAWLTYSSGRWYTEGYSGQASPTSVTSGWRDL